MGRLRPLVGAVLGVEVLTAVLLSTDLGGVGEALISMPPWQIAVGLGLLLVRAPGHPAEALDFCKGFRCVRTR